MTNPVTRKEAQALLDGMRDDIDDDDAGTVTHGEQRRALQTIIALDDERERLVGVLRNVDFRLNGFPEALRATMPHQSETADLFQKLLIEVRATLKESSNDG